MGLSLTERERRWGLALAIISAAGFSAKAILVKLAYPYGMDAVTLLALRMLFALPVFVWVGLRAAGSGARLTGRDWGAVALLGCLGYYGASILDFLGLQYISAGLERLILFTYPTLVLLLGFAVHRRPVTRREMAALVLCYAGIAAAFAHDLDLSGDPAAIWLGAGLVFGSSVSYAFYLFGSGGMIARLGSARFTALAMLVSTAVTLGHFAARHSIEALRQPWQAYALAAAMAVLSTIVPVFAQSAAIRRIGSGQAGMVSMIGPLLTIVFAWLVLDESISAAQLAGLVLVLAGVSLVMRQRQ